MMKKLISILLVCVMVCVSMVPVMAEGPQRERVTIEVDTFAGIYEFYKSHGRDMNKQYSFTIKNHPESRKRCPNCGKTAMTGQDEGVDELDPYPQQCPGGPAQDNDFAVVMFYHYRERCHNCGYEIVHDQYYFNIFCTVEMPDLPSFEAWDGQSWQNGDCDIHEDKSTWWNVPARYH